MRVLVACEFSGIVRDAFISRGHEAVSCDLEPTERPGPHIRGDVRPLLREPWDLVLAFPECKFLTNSGALRLYRGGRTVNGRDEARWDSMRAGAAFFRECLDADAPAVAVENPVMHGHARALVGRRADFSVQPWQFGHGECKRTCFWTRGLPALEPTDIVEGREQRVANMAPGPDRTKERSRFYPGFAAAMAAQWG